MIEIEGLWFDGKTSGRHSAKLLIDPSGCYILKTDPESKIVSNGDFQRLEVSPRLAATPRRIALEAGAVFETADNDSVDSALKLSDRSGFDLVLHGVENRWIAVMLSLLMAVLLLWAFVSKGVPLIATAFASGVPAGYLQTSDRQILAVMDRFYLQPSTMAADRRSALRAQLLSALPELDVAVNIQFRAGGELGANAFALPGGTVVFTDELLQLAENTEQIQAVFAHEIAHLTYRHGLRRVAQNSIVSALVILLTGDATATSDLLTALPFLLTDMAYSRQFETEADDYVWQYLSDRDIAPHHFSNLMIRLECRQRSKGERQVNLLAFNNCLSAEEWRWQRQGREWAQYLLSHPPSVERIERFHTK